MLPNNLQTQNSYRRILNIALPMSLAIMIPQISILVNTIFLGNYQSSDGKVMGKDVLAVAGVAGIYYFMFVMITFGLATGILVIMSRRAGENDVKGVGKSFGIGFQLGLIVSFVLLLIAFFMADAFFDVSLKNPLVQSMAQGFIKIRLLGLPFIFLAHLGNMLFIAVDKTRYMLFGTLGETIVTIALDYVLIFGYGPFPELGISGAAIASVVAELVFFLVVYAIIFYHKDFKQFQIRLFSLFNIADLKNYLVLSSPLMLQFFVSIGAWEVFFIFVEHLGERELAASQILRSVYGIMGIIVWALANTANSMVSNLYGQQQYNEVLPLIKKIIRISFAYAFVVSIVLWVLHKPFIAIYTNDPDIRELARPALFIVLFASLIFSISTIYFNAMLGLGNTKKNLLYETITIAIYLIYCFIVIEKLQSPLWIAWTAELVYWSCMLFFSYRYLHAKKWALQL